ncbi:exodeoxyribonuclease VII small subunit [Ammonicoccus fulvus]|uniref:Exodeoxyribonuclease 7 small subunit n=2 Tax=Ammonicoccus fulvus TaxID=3138240 RepID=A0ABZ3FY04_9ACTN
MSSEKTEMSEEPSYEAARDELIQIVKKLEAGGATLAESMQLWERGEKLAEVCQRWLDGARARIDQARQQEQQGEGQAQQPGSGASQA